MGHEIILLLSSDDEEEAIIKATAVSKPTQSSHDNFKSTHQRRRDSAVNNDDDVESNSSGSEVAKLRSNARSEYKLDLLKPSISLRNDCDTDQATDDLDHPASSFKLKQKNRNNLLEVTDLTNKKETNQAKLSFDDKTKAKNSVIDMCSTSSNDDIGADSDSDDDMLLTKATFVTKRKSRDRTKKVLKPATQHANTSCDSLNNYSNAGHGNAGYDDASIDIEEHNVAVVSKKPKHGKEKVNDKTKRPSGGTATNAVAAAASSSATHSKRPRKVKVVSTMIMHIDSNLLGSYASSESSNNANDTEMQNDVKLLNCQALQARVQELTTSGNVEVKSTYTRLWGNGKVIQWSRQETSASVHVPRNASIHTSEEEDKAPVPITDIVVVLWNNPLEFLQMLYRSTVSSDTDTNSDETAYEDSDDYPKLATWVDRFIESWRRHHPDQDQLQQLPRIYFLLQNAKDTLDQLWVKLGRGGTRNRSADRPPTTDNLQDAEFWLLLQHRIECIHCKDVDRCMYELGKITHMLQSRPTRSLNTSGGEADESILLEAVQASLTCVQKRKAQCGPEELPALRAHDTWKRQLSQVKGISYTMAQHMSENHYPTLNELWQAYNRRGEDKEKVMTVRDKREMLSQTFRVGNASNTLSHSLYELMTSEDPQKLL